MNIYEKEGVTFTRNGEDFRHLRNHVFTKANTERLRRAVVEAVRESFSENEAVRALVGQQRAIAERINGLHPDEIRNLAQDLANSIEVGTHVRVGELSPNDGRQKISIIVSFEKAHRHARLLLPPTIIQNYLDIQQARKLKELFGGQGRAEFCLNVQYSCPEDSKKPVAAVDCVVDSTNTIINAIAQNKQVFAKSISKFLEDFGGGA